MGTREKAEARFQLGQMYEFGDGVPCSDKQAAHWYGLAAKDQHPDAIRRLAKFYARGRGVVRDLPKAIELLNESQSLGDKRSGRLLEKLKNIWVVQGARDHEVSEAVGQSVPFPISEEPHDAQLPVSEDPREVAKQVAGLSDEQFSELVNSAKGFDVTAMIALGDYYQWGQNIRDLKHAFAWYLRAKERNSRLAKLRLAQLYKESAKDLFLRAVDKFIASAQLGDREALEWCIDNDESHPKLQVFMASLYLSGDGVRRNTMRARSLVRKAKEAGYDVASPTAVDRTPSQEFLAILGSDLGD